ncbi:MAG: ABC transporter, permease protein 1 (cluster 5, nickel/peptides/opines) [Ktedonobacterales bacterium]|jgi:peptide/nickel transport system permease protein|nr:MAG: ABC transporter, permease protein 1 (cluster 5, nickel/peptides/opines) [Ktedonobacterales bacterium]
MRRYVIRRLIQAVVMLFVMSIGLFLLIHAMPGGPDAVLFSPRMTAATRANLRHQYGLDQPLIQQYLSWLKSVLTGNLGFSFASGQPVAAEIGARIPATLELFAVSLSFALVVAILLGVISAVRQYSLTDYSVTVLSYFGIAMPVFFFALIMQEIFGVKLGWLPTCCRTSADTTGFTAFENFQDAVIHLIMPAVVLSFLFIAGWSRYLRSSMLDVVKQDYIRTAKAKGLASRSVFFGHALRNALIPLLTQVAIDVGAVFGGAVITETIFAWPGLGKLFYNSLQARDYPVLLSMLLLGAASVIVFNLLADVLYAVIDPRIRYS